MSENFVIIVAGGKGLRMQSDLPKQFIEINGKPILVHSIEKFLEAIENIRIILVLPETYHDYWGKLKSNYLNDKDILVVAGGETRFDSVRNGLSQIHSTEGVVGVHDAVRPCISADVIEKSYKIAYEKGNAIVSVALKDSIRIMDEDTNRAVDRSKYRIIQTPQVFKVNILKSAFENASSNLFTDDASVVEAAGHKINLVEGNYQNIKVTTPEDLDVATVFLKKSPTSAGE